MGLQVDIDSVDDSGVENHAARFGGVGRKDEGVADNGISPSGRGDSDIQGIVFRTVGQGATITFQRFEVYLLTAGEKETQKKTQGYASQQAL